jgi:dipeptidyl-peptidase-4
VTRLSIQDIGRLPLPGLDAPGSIAFTPDGSALTYLQSPDGSLVRSLWRHDLVTGERAILAGPMPAVTSEADLSPEEQLRRERARVSELGVTDFAWAARSEEPTLLVPLAGRAYVAVGDDSRSGVREVPGVEQASAVLGSPDGRWIAFVRDGDLWVTGTDGAGTRRLTVDAEPGLFNGLAEYVAAEELGRYGGLWWSADSGSMACAMVDERHLPLFVIPHLAAGRPEAEEHRYPFAGGPNARVRLRVLPLDGAGGPREVALGMAMDDYLARVVALPGGGWLVAVLPRAQTSLRWLRVTSGGEAEELWIEQAEPWINLDDDTRALEDGRILRSTERSGFRHLELRGPDGGLQRTLTAGPWMVTGVVHVDERRGEVLFHGTPDGATERHLYSVPLDAPAPVEAPARLTVEPGWHEVVASRDGRRWADTWSDLEHAPRVVVHDRDGQEPEVVVHRPSASAASLGAAPPELSEVTAADGVTTLHAALYRPEPAGVGQPPPVVVWVYGGPHAHYVKRAWELTVHGLRRYLAQSGTAVLVVDNRGSAARGLAFEAPLNRRLGQVEIADQAAALRQLAAAGEVDATRVAIVGGSYGGYLVLRAMAQEPDLFGVGVAIAPVTDWDGYDTAYTERYLGLPGEEPAAYRETSVLGQAEQLRGELLLIHGGIDENVHLRHSVRLLAALQAAERDVELVVLPTDRHRPRSPRGVLTRDRRTVRHLLGGLGLTADVDARVAAGTAAPAPG